MFYWTHWIYFVPADAKQLWFNIEHTVELYSTGAYPMALNVFVENDAKLN